MLFMKSEEQLLHNIKVYQVLAFGFIVLGATGIVIGIYGLMQREAILPIIGFISYAFGFVVFGMIFLEIFRLIKKLHSKLQISESEKKWVIGVMPIRVLSIGLVVSGILGMGLCIYVLLFHGLDMYSYVRFVFFIFYSVNFIVFGLILYKACVLLQKLGIKSD